MSAALLAVVSFSIDSPARAQTQRSDAPKLEQIVVTGTRIERPGFSSPTPLTSVGQSQIEQAAPSNVADFINFLPQLSGSQTSQSAEAGIGGGLGGANLLNLRGLGPDRTLVLLNGNRVIGASTTGAVDINLLPTALLKRVDIVTGGASATYGSDAVAGVVNFILDNNFTGFKANVSDGITTYGDGQTQEADLSLGSGFAGGRGHIIASAQFENAAAINDDSSRPWFAGYKALGNPNWTASNGQPFSMVLPGVGFSSVTPGGVITKGPLAGTQFGPGGVPEPFYKGVVNGVLMYGGSAYDPAALAQLRASDRRELAYSRISYDASSAVEVYAEAQYGRSVTDNLTAALNSTSSISTKNPYIPASLVIPAGVTSFQLGRYNEDLGRPDGHNNRQMQRYVLGADGSFFANGKWSTYYQYGRVSVLNSVRSDPILGNYNSAINAVANPATGGVPGVAAGAPVCASTITNPPNGCQPFDPFGNGSSSAASRAYILGTASQHIILQQQVAAVNGQMEPFSLWAGPVSVSAGLEWRREQYHADADPLSIANGYWVGNYKPGLGSFDVNEIYAESVVPLLRNVPMARNFDLDGAVRSTDYSTSGRVTTWKVGITDDINTGIRVRATRSRDIRAPNLNDYYLGGSATTANVPDVFQPTQPSVLALVITSGNPALKPEVADTTTVGTVLRPHWTPGLELSVDYYDIKIKDAIVPFTATQLIDACYGIGGPAVPADCSQISLATPGTLAGATINVGGENAQSVRQTGLDLELDYRLRLQEIAARLPGAIEFNGYATAMTKSYSDLAGTRTNLLNCIDSRINCTGPDRKIFASLGYVVGPSHTALTLRSIGSSVYRNVPSSAVNGVFPNHVSGVTYFDFSELYNLSAGDGIIQLYFDIQNLMNRAPPVAPDLALPQLNAGTTPLYFDQVGRMFRLGFRYRR